MKLQARVASQCSLETLVTDDAYWAAAVRAMRTQLTKQQLSILYLRLEHKMGVFAIAEGLCLSPSEVEREESAARDRILAALKRDDRRS